MPKGGNYETKPDDACYVEGMFVEGARWDNERMLLAESLPKKLYLEAPMLWLQLVESHKKKQFPNYLSPIYRTSKR
jgi:dynein heavy chain